ncbi:MAG: disulfide reductase, partial [Anaerolineae bacterium]|nr:disulfide reductase [Anaerolineae bacterium]
MKMRYFYFPGCTLETKAVGFNRSAQEAAGAL